MGRVFFPNSPPLNFQLVSCIHYQESQLLKTDEYLPPCTAASTRQGRRNPTWALSWTCTHSRDTRVVADERMESGQTLGEWPLLLPDQKRRSLLFEAFSATDSLSSLPQVNTVLLCFSQIYQATEDWQEECPKTQLQEKKTISKDGKGAWLYMIFNF